MRRTVIGVLAVLLLLVLAAGPGLSQSTLGPGPKVTVSILAHPIPTHPQYSKLDLPEETAVSRRVFATLMYLSNWRSTTTQPSFAAS